jgi:hydroxymethylbilane synthase
LNTLTIGSRGSDLALKQTAYVKNLLQEAHPDLDIKVQVIKTKGDLNLDKSIEELGGKSAFTSEIENQILKNKIDIAVHSLKDLPINLMDGLMYLGSPDREDVRDVFISNKWNTINEVPQNGVIATGSIRRKAQLLSLRPDLNIQSLRGNIDTRIRKLDDSEWDGMITAAAAMHRLGLKKRISEYLDVMDFVPAACQGALGIEVNLDDKKLISILNGIIHENVTMCCKTERLFLSKMESGCFAPIGCLACINSDGEFMLTGYVASMNGKKELKKTMIGIIESHERLALDLVDYMVGNGAKEIMA